MTTREQSSAYALGHSDRELNRLSAQAQVFEPFTRQLFLEAGLVPGLRVLDVGSGSGDVAFLAAEIVGAGGDVVGLDKASEAVARASARAADRQLSNVRFLQSDLTEIGFEQPFDAIVGRLVLMYLPDPAATLRSLARHLRPGGLIIFQEFDVSAARALPATPLLEQCMGWVIETFRQTNTDTQMGLKLFPTFIAAGLPDPLMRLDGIIGGGPDYPGYQMLVEVIRSLLPLMEKFGVATPAEVDVETLADRVRDEFVEGGGVLVFPSLIGAWSRS